MARTEVLIKDIQITEDTITANLIDGRIISVPLAWSWRLSEATPEQRENYAIIGDGAGVRWSDIDEDIGAEGMLYGVPARRPGLSRAVESAFAFAWPAATTADAKRVV